MLVDQGDGHFHLAPLGKLDGVVDQIDQYLAQAQRIAAQEIGHGRGLVDDDLDLLALGQIGKHAGERIYLLAQVKIDLFQGQLAGLHLGQVQNVVDEQQQGI